MSQYVETPCRTFNAVGAIAQHQRVKLGATGVDVAGLDDIDIGTAEVASLGANQKIPVRMRNSCGTVKMVAAEAFAVGASLYSAASGRVADTAAATSYFVGIALEEATAAGDVVEVLRFVPGAAVAG